MCRNCSTTSRYPGRMILTSLSERNARGKAAETAASPPTRTKSSISVVTNKTLKERPRSRANSVYARKVPVFRLGVAEGSVAARGRNASHAGRRDLGSRRAGTGGPREFGMTLADQGEGNLTKSFKGLRVLDF